MYDISGMVKGFFDPVIKWLQGIFFGAIGLVLLGLVVFVLFFFVRYRIRLDVDYLARLHIRFLPYDALRWLLHDCLYRHTVKTKEFREFGFTIYTGPQGSGKTLSLVDYLRRMREKFPKCKIVTNFAYDDADYRMKDWKDLFEIRNGEDGVIFAIDEIHSEYSSAAWKDFPESLLSQISQQRKQRIKICATSQVFGRVAKPIREQCFSVVCCSAYLWGRLLLCREYDAALYVTGDTPYQVRKKVKPLWVRWYVASDTLRQSYDTYEVIERLERTEFMPRSERR